MSASQAGAVLMRPWVAVLGSTLAAVLLISTLADSGSGARTTAVGATDSAPQAAAASQALAAPAPVEFEPLSFSGTGDANLPLALPAAAEGRAIVTVEHTGASNFVVWTLDAAGARDTLVFNEIGGYTGSELITTAAPALQVDADGPWTATVAPESSAPAFDGTASGTGSSVLSYTGDGGAAQFTHTGPGAFAVWQHTAGAPPFLLTSAPAALAAPTPMPAGPIVLIVQADGPWSVAVS